MKALVTEQLEGLGIGGSRAKTIVKAIDTSSIEVEDGKLKDPEKVKADLIESWGDLIPKMKVEGRRSTRRPRTAAGPRRARRSWRSRTRASDRPRGPS